MRLAPSRKAPEPVETRLVDPPRPRTTRRPAPSVDPGESSPRVRRAVKIRRSLPIRAYIGPNGHGKSLAAVVDLLPSLERGRTVLSTVPLLDWTAVPDPDVYALDPDIGLAGAWVHKESGSRWMRPVHPAYVRLTEWSQIMAAENCDVFLDEVAGVASSRAHTNMPAAIEKLLQKLRKGDITLSWTAPSWARADLIIREVTQGVTVAEGYRPEKAEHDGRLWKRNRQFEWITYDASVYTDWTEGKREKARCLAKQRFWGPGSDAFNAYDSLGGVDTITSVTDAGRCVSCGGTRRAPACSCAEYVDRMAESVSRPGARQRSARGGRDAVSAATAAHDGHADHADHS